MLTSPIRKTCGTNEAGRVFFERQGHICYLILDGSTELNPITPEMSHELHRYLLALRDDPSLWVGIVTAAGSTAFATDRGKEDSVYWGEESSFEAAHRSFWNPRAHQPNQHTAMLLNDADLQLHKPVIAALNGDCLGLGFIYVCIHTDIRLAVPGSRFGFADEGVRVLGGAGWSGIAARMEKGLASWLALTGEPIDVEQAVRFGLINQIVPLDQILSRAEEVAENLCDVGPYHLQIEKEILLRDADGRRAETRRIREALTMLAQLGVK